MARQTIGEFLQTLRKANGYTQQEVAEKLGISNKTLSAWETDRTYPDLLSIPALAELYGVTADEILRGERVNPDGQKKEDGKLSEKCERAALQNKYLKFNTQSYALLIPSCAAAVLIFAAMFPSVNFGIVLLVLGIVALITAIVLQTVFYKNALIGAGIEGEPLTAAQTEFVKNVKATLFRCLKTDGIVYTAAGAVMFIVSLVTADESSATTFSGFYYITAAITMALGVAALIAAERNAEKKPSRIYTEEQKIIVANNRKLLTKCIIGAAIPCVIITAAALLCLLNTFYKTETLYSGSANQVKTYLQTLIVEQDSELHDLYDVAPAGYYFDLPAAEDVQPFESFDLEHGFSAYYNPSSEAFVVYYTDSESGYEILASYAYRIMVGGTTAYNVRYCATQETDASLYDYDGYLYYNSSEDSVELTDEINDIYTVKATSEVYIYDGFVCWLWLGLSAAAVAISAIIYLVKRKKVE